MKQLLVIFLGAIFLCSCITQKKCNERYPPQVKDSSYTTETLTNCIDTLWLPGDSISIPGDSIPCPELKYHRSQKQGHLTATIDINKGILKFDCKEDSLEQIIKDQKAKIETNRTKTEIHTLPQEFIVHWYHTASIWASIIEFILLLLFFLLKKKN